MIRRYLTIIALLFSVGMPVVQAQVIDSVKHALTFKPRWVFGLNSKTTTVSGDPYKTIRLFTGVEYNRKIRFEAAFNYMPLPAVNVTYRNNTDTLLETSDLKYFGLQTEYTFLRKNRWVLSYPIQLGIGQNRYTERVNGNLSVVRKKPVVPIELGANAVYLFTDWFGIKAGMGVRLSLGKSFSTLSGSYYNLGLALYAGELYKQVQAKRNNT